MPSPELDRRIRKAVRLSLNEIGRRWVKRLRDRCGTPYPPASRPGESPHRRTRVLIRSFKYKVKAQARTVEDLRVFIDNSVFEQDARSGYNYADDLEHGTGNMEARPYWRPTRDEIQPKIAPWFHEEFQKNMGRAADAAGDFDSSDAAADFPASGGDSGFPE